MRRCMKVAALGGYQLLLFMIGATGRNLLMADGRVRG